MRPVDLEFWLKEDDNFGCPLFLVDWNEKVKETFIYPRHLYYIQLITINDNDAGNIFDFSSMRVNNQALKARFRYVCLLLGLNLNTTRKLFNFWLRQDLRECHCVFAETSLSWALNFHLSWSDIEAVLSFSFRSLSVPSQLSLSSLSAYKYSQTDRAYKYFLSCYVHELY